MPRKRHHYDKRKVNAYGGELQKSRLGRFCARPVWAGYLMHLIFKSTQASGERGFRVPKNYQKIGQLIESFGEKHEVKVHDYAIHHNHVHLSVTPASRKAYTRYIRALTSAIAICVGKVSRWDAKKDKRFFDYRPFTRIAVNEREEITIFDYLVINKLEAAGFSRAEARRFFREEYGKIKRPPRSA